MYDAKELHVGHPFLDKTFWIYDGSKLELWWSWWPSL